MSCYYSRRYGFSLLEVAIVLLITSVLMGSMLRPYGTHIQERQRAESELLLRHIRSQLLGFVAANHRLPCPLVSSAEPMGDCSKQHGYVPGALLGIDARVNEKGLLIDAWGNPVRYSVTGKDSDGDGSPDFTVAFGMQSVGMHVLDPDFEVCDRALVCGTMRANQVPVVIYSAGLHRVPRSDDERENTDDDTRFVMRDPDSAGDDLFDDLLVWISENSLYMHMIKAGVLP